ncbi:hypothetical protein BSNK01_14660 [Bacillaceae bacterium]
MGKWLRRYEKGFQAGYQKGKVTGVIGTFVLTFPLLLAGALTLFARSAPAVREGVKKVKDTDLYNKYFNKDEYERRRLERAREFEGRYDDMLDDPFLGR